MIRLKGLLEERWLVKQAQGHDKVIGDPWEGLLNSAGA